MLINHLKQKVLNGLELTKEEALSLVEADLKLLCSAADEIRKKFCGNKFEICSIVNAKSGRCSEDCKFCSQSSHYKTKVDSYPLMGSKEIFSAAERDATAGVQRFAPVTSGRKLCPREIDRLCVSLDQIRKHTNLKVCASCGLLNKEDLQKLKDAGLSRYHNNMESSESFFKTVCSTHTTKDKLQTVQYAKDLGIEVCSGGIVGLGESWEDRIEMAFLIRKIGVVSIPINMLSPIPGTPYESNCVLDIDEMRRVCAIFRFINPNVFIRLAGGRGLLKDKGRSCLTSGANALISGDMLTTFGISIDNDLSMIKELGYSL